MRRTVRGWQCQPLYPSSPRFLRNCVTFDSPSESLGRSRPEIATHGFSNRPCRPMKAPLLLPACLKFQFVASRHALFYGFVLRVPRYFSRSVDISTRNPIMYPKYWYASLFRHRLSREKRKESLVILRIVCFTIQT